MNQRRYTDLELYKRLTLQARPHWGKIALIFFLTLLAAPLALLPPLPLKLAVDCVLGDEPLPGFLEPLIPAYIVASPTKLLAAVAVLVVIIAALVYLHSLAAWLLKTYTGEKLVLEFRSRIFRHVQGLSLKYHDTRGTADSTYRIQYDSNCVRDVAMEGITPFLTSFLTLAAMLYVTARINWQIALIALAVAPVLFVLAKLSRKRLRGSWGQVKELESGAMSLVQEVLGAVRVVKAFGRENDEQQRFENKSNDLIRGHLRVAWIQGGFDTLVGLTVGVGTAAVLYVGVSQVRNDAMTLGDLLLVMAYLTQLYQPLTQMSNRIAKLQSSLASAERVFCLLDEDPDVPDRPNAENLERASGKFALYNIQFAFDRKRPVLQGINVNIPAGSRVGIVGQTGAGKSTLISLLMRFYDPTQGEIRLDDRDLREIRLADLRKQFAVVLQEPVLFSTSIGENIAYARPSASDKEIQAAALAANAHYFISDLPNGYQTHVGERGLQLSGGERQRVSLARAFLRDAPILILDEPTSSVDIETEADIMDAMDRLMAGRTTFMIAHRLITLRSCDMILRLENGQLLDILRPEEIQRFVAQQFGPRAVASMAGDESI